MTTRSCTRQPEIATLRPVRSAFMFDDMQRRALQNKATAQYELLETELVTEFRYLSEEHDADLKQVMSQLYG